MQQAMFADKIIQFCQSLGAPENLPEYVEILNPYRDKIAMELSTLFYKKYYSDDFQRIIMFGINPGRFGGGVTGVPFSDPQKLQDICMIPNDLEKKQELSAKFIYDVVEAVGGPEKFFKKVFFSAVSPLGYTKEGKNLNYYDIPEYKSLFEEYVVEKIKQQLDFNINRDYALCIGQGTNLKYLSYINKKYGFFKTIETVPHPRWVMQYRLKTKEQYIDEYLKKIFI